jgi:glycosyltransferase involved in cell wall biosynthesis
MLLFSVVIPTYNRVERLKAVIRGLERQDFPLSDFEVVVVSDGSTDGTDEYLAHLHTTLNLRFFTIHNQGAGAARNVGVEQARGKYILFIDDDVVPAPGLISAHQHCHASRGEKTVVLGPMLSPSDFHMTPWVQWEQKMLEKQYQAMLAGHWQPTARQFYTGNTSVERTYLLASGGFDPRFRRAEDVELAYRLEGLDLTFVFNPEAVGYHYPERSFTSWLDIPLAYGRNDVIFAREKGHSWILPAMAQEFASRHFLTRALVRVSLGRPVVGSMSERILSGLIRRGHWFGLGRISLAACSALFNLRYYQGAAHELGGPGAFLALLQNGAPAVEGRAV